MRELTIMLKPASGLCNMRCKYCFYYDVMDHREVQSFGMMTDDVAEEIVKKALSEDVSAVHFLFQGGEPTLAGLDYFKKFVQLVKKYNTKKVTVDFGIQTNGTKLTDEFVLFFKENEFLVGISIDGPKHVHNRNRLTHSKTGSYHDVMNGLKLLQKHSVEFNILSVVTNESWKFAKDIYEFLKRQGTRYFQFIPCIDDFDSEKDYGLTSENFAKFYKVIFDLWYEDFMNGEGYSIQYFDNIAFMLLRRMPMSCTLFGRCIVHKVIESDGTVYPCDFYMTDDWKLGNIKDFTFTELEQSHNAKRFVEESIGVHEDCKKCPYFGLCRGGCKRNKEPFEKVENSKTKYCEGIIEFFDYSIDRWKEVITQIQNS